MAMPRMMDEHEVLKAYWAVMGEAHEWLGDCAESAGKDLEYINGVYDMAKEVLSRLEQE